MVPRMAMDFDVQEPEIVRRLMDDSSLSQEIKAVYYRLTSHKYVEKLLERTPASALFWICEEYRKHPELYDEIFSGKIKLLIQGELNQAKPVIEMQEMDEASGLQGVFDPQKLIRQIVDKFDAFDAQKNQIKSIAVATNGNKILTVAFNAEKKIVSLFEDFIRARQETNAFLNFINKSAKKRVDVIRN